VKAHKGEAQMRTYQKKKIKWVEKEEQ